MGTTSSHCRVCRRHQQWQQQPLSLPWNGNLRMGTSVPKRTSAGYILSNVQPELLTAHFQDTSQMSAFNADERAFFLAHICKYVWPQFRVGGSLFLDPFQDFIEASIFAIKKGGHFGGQLGQKLILDIHFRYIGPQAPPGPQNRRSRTLKIRGIKNFFFACMQNSFNLAFICGPNYHD